MDHLRSWRSMQGCNACRFASGRCLLLHLAFFFYTLHTGSTDTRLLVQGRRGDQEPNIFLVFFSFFLNRSWGWLGVSKQLWRCRRSAKRKGPQLSLVAGPRLWSLQRMIQTELLLVDRQLPALIDWSADQNWQNVNWNQPRQPNPRLAS
jgi:hypothetical protein